MTGEERAAKTLGVPIEKVHAILAIQEPQVRAALMQSDEERIKARLAPIPKESQCLKEDGSVDLNVRDVTPEQAGEYSAFRRRRGKWIEEVRTQYLMTKAKEGKIHPSLMDKIETNHVVPTLEIKERAEEAFVRGSTFKVIKDKFKEIMGHLFKPTHAEMVASEMRKRNEE